MDPMIPPAVLEQLAAAGWSVRAAAPTQARGLKSDTFRIDHGSGSAILKIYNGRGGTPRAKCTREALALDALRSVSCIPRRLCHAPDAWLLMECLPGATLRSQWDRLDLGARRRLCTGLGTAYAGIACAPQDQRIHDLVRHSRPDSWVDSPSAALDHIDRLLRTEPRVARSAFAASAERIRAFVARADGGELLIKSDCNPDNTLSEGGHLTGIIDWEQACIGSRWIHYGIVLDHTHFLDWTAVRAGIEETSGIWSRDDEDLVLTAGFLCVWRKIIEFDARSAWFSDPGRQEARMRAMALAMGRNAALTG
jgi:aminoglycoside phosphotransferase (APT) family kinase protein